jgi:hypothetical protein
MSKRIKKPRIISTDIVPSLLNSNNTATDRICFVTKLADPMFQVYPYLEMLESEADV